MTTETTKTAETTGTTQTGDRHSRDRRVGAPPIALELLVHGVGGTTPEQMLADPRTVRVAGDDTAGLYRRARDADAERYRARRRGTPVPEAYCWSNLTSGNGWRALWLLLLPFMIANLAHWMRPPSRRSRLAAGYEVVVRLLALTLTVLLVAAACEVAMDAVAWQCAGRSGCSGSHSWLGFAAADREGWWSRPGRRLALAAAVPVALTGLLWLASRRSWSAYEAQRPAVPAEPPAPGSPALALPGFWYGRRSGARLRAAHTAVALATAATALTVPALTHDQGRGGPLRVLGWALAGSLALLTAGTAVTAARSGRREHGLDDGGDPLAQALPAVSAALLAAAALYAGWNRPGWASDGPLPAASAFFTGLTILQSALVAVLAVAAALLHRAPPPGHPGRGAAMAGQAGPAVALLACVIGGLFTGCAAQRAADWLDRGGTPGGPGSPLPGAPAVLTWQSATVPVVLAVVLVVAGGLALRLRRRERALRPEVERLYPGVPHQPARTRAIAAAIGRARLTDSAPLGVATLCGAAFVLGGGAVAGAWAGGGTPEEVAAHAPAPVAGLAAAAQWLGSWLAAAGAVALVAVGRRAYRDLSARRMVGILWDVGTFWPRAAHPFAPPCYAERAVPDLTWRLDTWTRSTGGVIVLSGHSQGSVLSAAAVWQLGPAARSRVALLTYGCPLARLYGRWFPAHFAPALLRDLHDTLPAWRNLWRRTDPIGGPVLLGGRGNGLDGRGSGLDEGTGTRVPRAVITEAQAAPPCRGDAAIPAPARPETADPLSKEPLRAPEPEGPWAAVDVGPLLDPVAYGRSAAHPLPEPVLAHTGFQTDPAYAEQRALLLSRFGPAVSTALPAPAPAEPDPV
ncbi:hypothetical protein [Actinacidiphila yeochonensis]|uniref:hypothetical protein n=1 Tax=Actinacidiphila yeochonensis TaxID=89050 RepID=UPI0012FF4A6B|nr:hypothetical protein [Actinacidiphila yeochonensis]